VVILKVPAAGAASVTVSPGSNTYVIAPCGAGTATFTVSGTLVTSK
jgi:bifunctional N-acetylglucosamine-1-phosphate-uridyltransferase/glucosamine-1-phosphate-acetyltransferase GlmU-like protein